MIYRNVGECSNRKCEGDVAVRNGGDAAFGNVGMMSSWKCDGDAVANVEVMEQLEMWR